MSEKARMQDNEKKTGPGAKFFVHVAGKTNEAHHEFIDMIKKSGHVEVKDRNACDYILGFCPVPSQAGTDVGETMENLSGPRAKFFVHEAGKTNRAHHELVDRIKQSGHDEVDDPDTCDYMLVFCPVASRVGTDVGETVENLPADKDIVLVVMHHTHNRSAVIAESSRLVKKPNIFTVDCLFYEGKLLTCDLNDQTWKKIQRHLDSHSRHSTKRPGPKFFVREEEKTNEADHEFIDMIKQSGHVEVKDCGTCDYILAFCPVASRVGTDVGETLENLPAEKDAVLIMHCTHNPSDAIAERSRQVNRPNQRNSETVLSQDSHSRHSTNIPGMKFFVHEAGKTNGAHHELVDWIKQSGHVEVDDPDTCDYVLSFCPVASRVGTDVGETLENLPADKDIVLVVMHHTHNRSAVIAESSRLVKKPNIFTVDCLFYEGKLLTCDFNDQTWKQIQGHLGISPFQDSRSRPLNKRKTGSCNIQ